MWWKVRAFDSDGIGSPWSRATYFEMGLLDNEDWRARWIGTPMMGGKRTPAQVPARAPLVRFVAAGSKVRDSTSRRSAYTTRRSMACVRIEVELAPGWTDFNKRVRYQTFDVTRLLKHGENVIGVLLGDGWYCGTLGLSDRQQYGDRPLLLAQIEITLADGSPLRVATDDLWKWQRSQILYSRPDVGRKRRRATESRRVDRARLRCGRLVAGRRVAIAPRGLARWECQPTDQSDRTNCADRGSSRRAGDFGVRRLIYDFGQNIVGRVRIKVRAPAAH